MPATFESLLAFTEEVIINFLSQQQQQSCVPLKRRPLISGTLKFIKTVKTIKQHSSIDRMVDTPNEFLKDQYEENPQHQQQQQALNLRRKPHKNYLNLKCKSSPLRRRYM